MRFEKMIESAGLEEVILRFICEYDYVTFAELQRRFAPYMEVHGEEEIVLTDMVVLWYGLSGDLKRLVQSLSDRGKIRYELGREVSYRSDGKVLALPVIHIPLEEARLKKYRKRRWLPVFIRPATGGSDENRDN